MSNPNPSLPPTAPVVEVPPSAPSAPMPVGDSGAGSPSGGGSGGASDQARQAADTAKAGAAEVGGEAQQKAIDVKDTAMGEARSVANDARDQASQVLGTAQEQLRAQAAEQTDRLSHTLKDLSRQLGQMADSSEEPDAGVVRLVRGAADQAGETATRLDDGGLDTLVSDVTRFARQRPGVFLLGSLAAGMAVGRLARHVDVGEVGQAAKDALQSESSTNDGPDPRSSGPRSTSDNAQPTGGTS